jgi:rare lipoprotein A
VRVAEISQFGKASWYDFVGGQTASGETLDTQTATAAHRSLPLASYAKVTNLDNRRSVIVKINERGPHIRGRIIDLSPRAADALAMIGACNPRKKRLSTESLGLASSRETRRARPPLDGESINVPNLTLDLFRDLGEIC